MGGNRRLSSVLGGGSLLPAAVLELGLRLCAALGEVYEIDESNHGLEPDERELRPENVLLTRAGDVASGDLGLPDFGAPLKDKPIYRAPEQLTGRLRDHRSDVFVLGALLYEAAVGQPLFDGPTGVDARFAVEHGLEGHLVLKDVVRTVDTHIRGLGEILEACLREAPEDRPADPSTLGRRLAELMTALELPTGALAKRVAMSPEVRTRSVSMPAASRPVPAPRPAPAPARPPPRTPAPDFVDLPDVSEPAPLEPLTGPHPRPTPGPSAPHPGPAARTSSPAAHRDPSPFAPLPPAAPPAVAGGFAPLPAAEPPRGLDAIAAMDPGPALSPPPMPEPEPPSPPSWLTTPPAAEAGRLDEPPEPDPPPPPSWLEATDSPEGGSSVEFSLEDIGRERSPPPEPIPPPPLAEAGAGFKLQAEEDPESTWNRLPPLDAPPELRQSTRLSEPDQPLPVDLLPAAPREKVPLRRTALSLQSKEQKDETLAGALRWFLSRILLYAAFVTTIVFALAWYDVFPDATSKAATRAWEATPSTLKDAVPDRWNELAVELWSNRVGAGAGSGLGAVVVQVVPEDIARSVEEVVAGAEPTPTPLDAGAPQGSGIVQAAAGWVEAQAEAKPSEGMLLIDAELEGRPLDERVKVEVLDADGAVVAEGTSGTTIDIDPGEWTARLTYRESDTSGEHVGTVSGIRTHVGHRSRYRTRVDLAVGFLDTRFLVDAVDVSPDVVLSGWPPKADRETSTPSWSGPGGTGLALPSGGWFVVAEYDDGRHAPTRLELGLIDVPPQHGRLSRKKSLQQGEELNPTGPGMDIEVTNFGEDVSGLTEIYAYRAGEDVKHATATASGRGAYYFDVPPGSYDLRFVFRPSRHNEDVVGEKVVTGFRVAEAEVKRATVDIGFAYSTLDVAVSLEGADVSDTVRAVVIGPGASFEGANRVLDAYLGVEHAIVSGSYDIYLVYAGPAGEVRRHFSMVDLRHGRVWKQRFSMNDAEWVARD